MNNNQLYSSIAIAALIGFGAAWLIKPTPQQNSEASSHQHTETTSEQIYTCSMHPQIRQNEPGICPICEMDLTLLEANTSNDPLVLQMTEEAVKLANIQTSTVGTSSLAGPNTISLPGKIQADERRTSSLVTHVPGRIEKLYVSFTGEQVNKGQKLADIYAPDLITAQQELFEAQKLKDVNPGLLEAARNKLRFWKIDETIISAIEQNGEIKETFTLYAEESGIVKTKRVNVGDYLNKGASLFEVINLSNVWVLFDAFEQELPNIKIGDQITFTTPSVPNKTFTTRITFIDPLIDPNSRTVALRTETTNKNGLLKPEMLVYGQLQNNTTNQQSLSVPKSAVLWTGKRSVVYVKMPDTEIPSFQFREVELGESTEKTYPLISGLEVGEEIVTYGSFSIDAAAQLNNQASMMNRNVQLKKEVVGTPDFKANTPDAFKDQLNILVDEYLLLKDAFVKTNSENAANAAQKVTTALANIDMQLLKGDAHIYWMEQLNALEAHSKNISESTNIEEQRKQFGFLSEALINTIKAFGISEKTIYVQHCPMAFNNQGGDWLASEEAIQNPYFGDKMMKCGSVKAAIPN